MFPKYVAQFAALLCLGLGLRANATPVITKNEKTGDVVIVDKDTGERVVMTAEKLTYSRYRRSWTKKINPKSDHFIGVLLHNKSIYSGTKEGRLTKYSDTGSIVWSIFSEAETMLPENIFSRAQLIYTTQCGEGAVIYCRGNYYNLTDGKNIHFNNTIVDERGKLLLIDNTQELSVLTTSMEFFTAWIHNHLFRTPFEVNTLNLKKVVTQFSTPPRKNCGDFKPSLKELAKVASEETEQIAYSGGYERTFNFFENVPRGDYIYAHRADRCGKFTYRFHWTDPKNPGPVILQGWR